MSSRHAVVAVYESREEAEAAITKLHRAGVDMLALSIIGRDWQAPGTTPTRRATDESSSGDGTGDSRGPRRLVGGVWSSFWGIMLGSAYLAVPGIGPLLAAGPVVGLIVLALESAVVLGGLTAIGTGLMSLGIPQEHVTQYEQALQADKYLVMVNGNASEVELARSSMTRPIAANPQLQMFASGVVI